MNVSASSLSLLTFVNSTLIFLDNLSQDKALNLCPSIFSGTFNNWEIIAKNEVNILNVPITIL